jgi:hypothetical protein
MRSLDRQVSNLESKMGKGVTGPTPQEVLETPIFYTICFSHDRIEVGGDV